MATALRTPVQTQLVLVQAQAANLTNVTAVLTNSIQTLLFALPAFTVRRKEREGGDVA
jgi:hypothetical protein